LPYTISRVNLLQKKRNTLLLCFGCDLPKRRTLSITFFWSTHYNSKNMATNSLYNDAIVHLCTQTIGHTPETSSFVRWQPDIDIYWTTTVPAIGLRGRYFWHWTTGFSDVASHIIACAAAATNHKTDTSLCVDHRSGIDLSSSGRVKLQQSFTAWICRGLSVLCGGKFHFCYETAISSIVQHFFGTDFIYIYIFKMG
jgi:hypothetical protein